jgi:membrane-associated phospholipid phosphatase
MPRAVALPSIRSGTEACAPQMLSQLRLGGLFAVVLLASVVTLLIILATTGIRLSTEFGRFVLLAGAVGGLAGFCRWRRHPWRLADSAIIISLVTLGLLLCGLVSCTGLRLGLPLSDALLARGDALFGLDVRNVSEYVAARPVVSELLYFAYAASGPVCAAAIALNLCTGDRVRLWQSVATIVVAMQLTAIISILFPAQGASVSMGLDALQGKGLPYGAGTYSASEFLHFYAGRDRLVAPADMNGVVCFPSFHTVMALVMLQAVSNSPLKWIALPASSVTIVSTIPMGGHYVTDLLGGTLVWAAACTFATWACQPSNPDREADSGLWQGRTLVSNLLPAR